MLVSTYIIGVFSSFLILTLVYKSAYYRLLQLRQPLPGPLAQPRPHVNKRIQKNSPIAHNGTQVNT